MATERRIKLTAKQFEHYSTARREAAELMQAAEAARTKFSTVVELLMDFHQIAPASNARVDEKTQEIVVTLDPEVPAPAPEQPAADPVA